MKYPVTPVFLAQKLSVTVEMNGLVVKSKGCSFRGPGFGSQNPCVVL